MEQGAQGGVSTLKYLKEISEETSISNSKSQSILKTLQDHKHKFQKYCSSGKAYIQNLKRKQTLGST